MTGTLIADQRLQNAVPGDDLVQQEVDRFQCPFLGDSSCLYPLAEVVSSHDQHLVPSF
jgi:hypothetical protein